MYILSMNDLESFDEMSPRHAQMKIQLPHAERLKQTKFKTEKMKL